MKENFHYTKCVNNNNCHLFDLQYDAKSIHPMIREIHDMIQLLKPRPKIIITIGYALRNYSHNDRQLQSLRLAIKLPPDTTFEDKDSQH